MQLQLNAVTNWLVILGAIKKFSAIQYSVNELKSEIQFKNLTSLLEVEISEVLQSLIGKLGS